MLWEIVATAVAGVGAGGIALGLGRILRRRSAKRQAPGWTVPVAAAIGMLGFQIYSEYHWFSHQSSLLPDKVVVVKQVQETALWRPWSLLFPQTLRFLAVDTGNAVTNPTNPALVLADVYVFQRRQPAQRVRQVFHCEQLAWAPLSEALAIPATGEQVNHQWHKVARGNSMLTAVCS